MKQTIMPRANEKKSDYLHQIAQKALETLIRGKAAGLRVPKRVVAKMAILAMKAAPEGSNKGVDIL